MPGGDHHDHDDHTVSLNLNNLKVISALGRGAKGLVFLVQTETGELLALKAILASSIHKMNSSHGNEYYKRFCFERRVLSSFDHPLLPKLHGVLITDNILGCAIDYCPGRDLNSLRKIQTEKLFSDDIIRFYAAELVLAVEYLHKLGIVYRDLKPENVMIQHTGHLMLVDFDLSTKLAGNSPPSRCASQSKPEIKPKKKKILAFFSDSGISPEETAHRYKPAVVSSEKSNSFVGTEDYLAPEMILGHGHDFAVDWWCLGVVLYEMLYGTTPFRGSTRKDTYHRIITQEARLTGECTPLRDLIRKLLEKDPTKRICVGEIKGHDFFKAVDWEGILEIPRPPFIPELTDVGDLNGNKEINLEKYILDVFSISEEGKV
ncbi:hypothetical protein ACS0TY_015276 [Phlomoides rotata]